MSSLYIPFRRVKRAEGVAILRPFEMKVVPVRPSPAQDAELKRLDQLNRTAQLESACFAF